MKYIEELERNKLPIEGQAMLPLLETLDFINEGRSAVMYGNPGTGKTHMAIALGVKACLEGYSVFFTSIPRLLTQIREAKTDRTLRNLEVKFERFDLVICDELGYVGFDKEGPRCCLTTSRSELERRLPLSQPTCLSPDGRKC